MLQWGILLLESRRNTDLKPRLTRDVRPNHAANACDPFRLPRFCSRNLSNSSVATGPVSSVQYPMATTTHSLILVYAIGGDHSGFRHCSNDFPGRRSNAASAGWSTDSPKDSRERPSHAPAGDEDRKS